MACTDGIKRPCFNPTMSKGGLPSAFCLQHKCLLNSPQRRKFYDPDATLNFPIYLESDVNDFLNKLAKDN